MKQSFALESLESLDSDLVQGGGSGGTASGRVSGACLHTAIANNDHDSFKRLIKQGVPMEVKNHHGLSPLQVVCAKQDVEMVNALLRQVFFLEHLDPGYL